MVVTGDPELVWLCKEKQILFGLPNVRHFLLLVCHVFGGQLSGLLNTENEETGSGS